VKATIAGNIISVFVNNKLIDTVKDDVFKTGNPEWDSITVAKTRMAISDLLPFQLLILNKNTVIMCGLLERLISLWVSRQTTAFGRGAQQHRKRCRALLFYTANGRSDQTTGYARGC